MSFHPRACVKIVRLCLMSAAAYGLDIPALLDEFGLDAAALADPYTRVSHELVARLWQAIPERAGDAAFGLHAAERLHAVTFDAFDAAMRHCGTLREVVLLLSRNVRLMHEAAVIEIEEHDGIVRCIERWLPPAVLTRHLGEMILAMWILRLRQMSGTRQPVREISFMHAAPADLSEHKRIFDAPLVFSADAYSMTAPAAFYDAKVMGADPILSVVLDRHLREETARLPPTDDLLAAVKQAAKEALTDPALSIDRLARRLHTSQRTLQRRLAAAGTSCQALIEQARREQALQLLRDPRLTLADIAFMAGYSEMSAFYRAFRRWTGQTPREYRDSAGQA